MCATAKNLHSSKELKVPKSVKTSRYDKSDFFFVPFFLKKKKGGEDQTKLE